MGGSRQCAIRYKRIAGTTRNRALFRQSHSCRYVMEHRSTGRFSERKGYSEVVGARNGNNELRCNRVLFANLEDQLEGPQLGDFLCCSQMVHAEETEMYNLSSEGWLQNGIVRNNNLRIRCNHSLIRYNQHNITFRIDQRAP